MQETVWRADRQNLQRLMAQNPAWTQRQYAAHLQRSLAWVKKWQRRFRERPDDPTVCQGESRARKTPVPPYSDAVIHRILALRDSPPPKLNRIAGPKTIRYYLDQDIDLTDERRPRSTRTIWRILRQHQRIVDRPKRVSIPLPRPAPMTRLQLDFKSASTVPADPEGKQQHVVEILNTLDVGTSSVVDETTRGDFRAETTVRVVAQLVQRIGVPQEVQFDRDPRFVGTTHYRDMPAPFVQFWLCLGVAAIINPPHRPDRNGFVERYHRSLKYECLWVHRPTTLEEVQRVSADYVQWYNYERPNQALTCGNQPPRVAFPDLPALPPPPMVVDPDRWVNALDGLTFTRIVQPNGRISIQNQPYYAGTAWMGQRITVRLDGPARTLTATVKDTTIKQWPLKGLVGAPMAFDAWIDHLATLARRTIDQVTRRPSL